MLGQIQRSAEKEEIYDPASFSNIFMGATYPSALVKSTRQNYHILLLEPDDTYLAIPSCCPPSSVYKTSENYVL